MFCCITQGRFLSVCCYDQNVFGLMPQCCGAGVAVRLIGRFTDCGVDMLLVTLSTTSSSYLLLTVYIFIFQISKSGKYIYIFTRFVFKYYLKLKQRSWKHIGRVSCTNFRMSHTSFAEECVSEIPCVKLPQRICASFETRTFYIP